MATDEPEPFIVPVRPTEHTSAYANRMLYLVDSSHRPYHGSFPVNPTRCVLRHEQRLMYLCAHKSRAASS
jgi:hypothetical protein